MPIENRILSKEERFFLKHYDQLKGKKVKDVVVDGGREPSFGLEFDDGTIAWIMCDPEGNGPGFLDIQKPENSNR